MNKGTYLLVIKIKKLIKIKVGSSGQREFEKGYYVYVGSAMNNLRKRIERHLKTSESLGKENKKHWHIDYLLSSPEVEIVSVYYKESREKQECKVAEKVKRESFDEVKGFGSSDCYCKSHLFKIPYQNIKYLIKGFNKMKLLEN